LDKKGLERIHEVRGKKFLLAVETSDDHREYQKYEELRHKIWGEPKDNLSGTRNMMCENFLHDGSSLFIGLYAEDNKGCFKQDAEHLVGFSYGFVGVMDKEIAFRESDNLQFYSQYTCVRQGFQHFGFGVNIKEFQREILLERFGIHTVTCTFDPLTGVNAHRNIHHFGMDVVEYRETYYGDFGGLLNRVDIPCDRLFVSWDLKKEIQRPEYDLKYLIDSGYIAVRAEIEKVGGSKGPVELEVVKDLNLRLDHEFLLVEIPVDFYKMLKETDVSESKVRNIPIEWRIKTRQAFKALFKSKYKIIDFKQIKKEEHKRDFYILKK